MNTGRRERNRAARHRQLLGAAGAILAEEGLSNLTMQAVAERVDCAVGTIYTYFDSKSALLAALQAEAIRVLSDSYDSAAQAWDSRLDTDAVDGDIAALARVLCFGRLFLAWPDLHPREFYFLQLLLVSREEIIALDDARTVVPHALTLLTEARVLIDAAVETGALRMNPDLPGDDSLSRTLRWAGGLDGAVLVAGAGGYIAGVDPGIFERHQIGLRLTVDLLTAWGARSDDVHQACELVHGLEGDGLLLPAAPTVATGPPLQGGR